jgi:hypothetical protein
MTSLFSLPDWLPWWVPIAVLVPALLYLLVFLLMPFSVFGLKGRLEAIELRLDEIQGEIRTLVLRLPESRSRALDWTEQLPPIAPAPHVEDDRPVRPPIPPAPMQAPRRPPAESGYRAPHHAEPPDRTPPDPSNQPQQAEDAPSDPAEDAMGPRRRPIVRPARPLRNEPRLDWPR